MTKTVPYRHSEFISESAVKIADRQIPDRNIWRTNRKKEINNNNNKRQTLKQVQGDGLRRNGKEQRMQLSS
jgi:hypothetical protein